MAAIVEELISIRPKPSDGWNVERIRKDFPVLRQTVNGKPLVYLDNAASSQVPVMVIERGAQYIEQEHSNIHRGVHYLSMKATTAYESARKYGAPVLIDGAQWAPHARIDVQDLDCDFYTFSGHKIFAPTGSGVVYGKADLLERMNPFQGGGDMIKSVTFEKTTYADLPNKFEAGTPAIASQIGLGAAIDYLNIVGREKAADYEHELLRYATERLSAIEGVRIIGTAREKLSVLSFTIENVHPHDIGTILDQQGIAIRAGHHCAQPVMQRLKIPATARASFAFYNTKAEVDVLVEAIEKVIEVFS